MKKIISVLVAISLITGTSTAVFADPSATGATASTLGITQSKNLTPAQQQARDAFLKVYYDLMNQLVALRQQTQSAVEANNSTLKQIKDKLKAKTSISSDTLSKLKELAKQRKDLNSQAKNLHQQRVSLKSQYKDAVKAKDLEKMKSIEQQILDLNKKISDLKAQDDAIKAQIAPLKEQLKSLRDANKQLKSSVKTQLQQAKTIQETIKTQEQEKAKLWNTFRENIKDKDYTAAEATLKAIIDKKSAILDNIKQRGTILNQILSSLN